MERAGDSRVAEEVEVLMSVEAYRFGIQMLVEEGAVVDAAVVEEEEHDE